MWQNVQCAVSTVGKDEHTSLNRAELPKIQSILHHNVLEDGLHVLTPEIESRRTCPVYQSLTGISATTLLLDLYLDWTRELV